MDWRIWRRKSRDGDLDEEIAYDLAAETEENIHVGMSRDEAERRSRKDFGNVLLVKEVTRDMWGWSSVERLGQDLRYALRQLARSPGFAAVAVLSLGLGIGANTAIFTLINVVMLKSLPVSDPEELLWLTVNIPGQSTGKRTPGLHQALWEQLRERQDVFAGMFAYGSTGGVDFSTGGEARPDTVGLVSGGFFETLGVRPVAGRIIVDGDDRRGCPGVAVITHGFWQSEYGGRPDIIGKSISLNHKPFEIVGVAGRGFFGIEYGYYVPVWAPMCAAEIIRPGAGWMGGSVIGRVKPGVSTGQVRARLAVLGPAILEATIPPGIPAPAAEQYRKATFGVMAFAHGLPFLSAGYGDALLILMAVVGVVLLIACANIANLLLARATTRQREIAVRLAVGGSRGRIFRQLLTESLLLSLTGAAIGVLLASWGSRAAVGFLMGQVVLDVSPDWNVLAFSIATGVFTGVLFGLAPAWRAVHVDLHAAMKPGNRGAASSHPRFRAGKMLVAAQIALSLLLMVGSGLLLGSWRRIVAIDPGFRSDGVLVASVNTRRAQLPSNQRAATYGQILERLRAIPGVSTASASSRVPFGGNQTMTIEAPGFALSPGNNAVVQFNEISEGYFTTMGTRLLAGRDFKRADLLTSPVVAIVSEELARKFFGRTQVIGEHFRARFGREMSTPVEIIGIAQNTKEFSLREQDRPIVYFALTQDPAPLGTFNFELRTAGPPVALRAGAKEALAAIDPRFSLEFNTLQARIDNSVRLPRTLGILAGFFGVLALLLASIGLYGIMSYTVARRRSEIGIRIALGAPKNRVIGMVLGDVGRIVIAGVAMGILISLALTKLVTRFLFGVEPDDPATIAISAITLIAVAIGAAMIPARRAARLDPMTALRED